LAPVSSFVKTLELRRKRKKEKSRRVELRFSLVALAEIKKEMKV